MLINNRVHIPHPWNFILALAEGMMDGKLEVRVSSGRVHFVQRVDSHRDGTSAQYMNYGAAALDFIEHEVTRLSSSKQ